MQDYFYELSDHLQTRLTGDEVFTATFGGEDSDFVRFNHGEVRQPGGVTQRHMTVDLIDGQRHASGTATLCGDAAIDRKRLDELVVDLRSRLPFLPEDPHLLYATEVSSSERHGTRAVPEAAEAVADIQRAGEGRDLVGIYAAGGIFSGFANSLGQRNWYDTWNYNFDWSFYHSTDKAVKSSYAGFEWKREGFDRKVAMAARQLEALARKPHTVDPGHYRVYLTPTALNDIVGMLSWGGFGLKMHKTKQTPLLKMVEGQASMDPSVTIAENTKEGIAPNFQGQGFIRPDRVPLIEKGAYADCLVSPRSAKEYGVPTNGASGWEAPESVDMDAGGLPTADVLRQLDKGIYVGNVWYLNYSDRSACRTTGMTRFATFWVEGGEIKAPLNVMRFDETIYRMLGENLVGLTAERDLILDPSSYFQRSTGSGRLPGALIDDFAFTL